MQFRSVQPEEFELYVTYANESFNMNTREAEYRHLFYDPSNLLPADLFFVVDDDGTILAGSSVIYREIRMASLNIVRIGIMGGSWTRPEARGKGCFTLVIHESCRLAAEHGVAFLTAFVTSVNASYRRLAYEGSALLPAFYVFTDNVLQYHHELRVQEIDLDETSMNTMYFAYQSQTNPRFHYDYTLFREQFFSPFGQQRIIYLDDRPIILSEKADLFKVLWMDSPDEEVEIRLQKLQQWAQRYHSKNLMYYTTTQEIADGLRENLTILDGYFTILATMPGFDATLLMHQMQHGDFKIHLGDKV